MISTASLQSLYEMYSSIICEACSDISVFEPDIQEKPTLFYIYEGGLWDPSLCREVVKFLRRHAEPGDTIVLVTNRFFDKHSPYHVLFESDEFFAWDAAFDLFGFSLEDRFEVRGGDDGLEVQEALFFTATAGAASESAAGGVQLRF